MTSLKTELFKRKASNLKNKPDVVLESLNLTPGNVVANVGVDGCYFTIRLNFEFAKPVNPLLLLKLDSPCLKM